MDSSSVKAVDWEYNSTQELDGKTYHVWERPHSAGYTAYALTLQPPNGSRLSFVKPVGYGHYVGELGLKRKTGLVVTSNSGSDTNYFKLASK